MLAEEGSSCMNYRMVRIGGSDVQPGDRRTGARAVGAVAELLSLDLYRHYDPASSLVNDKLSL